MADGSDHDVLVRIDQRLLGLETAFKDLRTSMEAHVSDSETLHQELLQRATTNSERATGNAQRTKAVESRVTKLEDQSDSHATAIITSFVVGAVAILGVVLTFVLSR